MHGTTFCRAYGEPFPPGELVEGVCQECREVMEPPEQGELELDEETQQELHNLITGGANGAPEGTLWLHAGRGRSHGGLPSRGMGPLLPQPASGRCLGRHRQSGRSRGAGYPTGFPLDIGLVPRLEANACMHSFGL